jgi:hypothetical protein
VEGVSMAMMKVLSKRQNLLLREFCKTFPPVINEKRPTGDMEIEVPKSILDDDKLCGEFLSSIWESKGWDSLGTASQMNEFMLFRTAPEMLFVMPFFRNIGYHPYTDKAGILRNDEPKWWLGDNNYWNKSLRLFKGCDETKGSKGAFAISFRYLDNKSLSQIRNIQVEKMEESFVEDDPEVLLTRQGVWSDLPTIRQIHFRVPFYTYRYPRSSLSGKQKLGITIEANEYTSVSVFTAQDWIPSQYRGSNDWMFIAPLEPEMKVLNWAALKEDDLREFISVL